MKSRLVAGLAAVVLAIVGAVLTFSYAQGADQRAVQDLEPVSVLVVAKAIPAGTPVESMAASLTTQQVPGTAVAKTAVKTIEGESGKVAAVDLVPGEQLVSERLIAPAELETPGSVAVPAGLQEVSFQIEPQRVVGGRITPGDHVGVFISLAEGGLESKADKETTKLTIRKTLITAVQRAPVTSSASPAPAPDSGQPAAPAEDTSLPTGSLLLTVAVSDIDAAKIVFASEYGSIWLSKEPQDAADNGPRIIQRSEVYK